LEVLLTMDKFPAASTHFGLAVLNHVPMKPIEAQK